MTERNARISTLTEALREYCDEYWPDLRLVYADIWALDRAEIEPSEFRFLKKSGELRLNVTVDSSKMERLPPKRQALVLEIALLKAFLLATERYKHDRVEVNSILNSRILEGGYRDLRDLGVP